MATGIPSTNREALPSDWQAFADRYRPHYPTVDAACDEAWGRGFDLGDVQGVQRMVRRGVPGAVTLILRDGEAMARTEFY